MPTLLGPALAAAALLALAGAQKVVDPTMTVGALKALGLPSSERLVRVGSAAELAVGIVAIVIGGGLVWALVAASYVAFAGFVVAALRRGTMLGSCGCFGREDTPPHPSHVALNLLLAGVATGAAAAIPGSLTERLADEPARGLVVVMLAGIAVYLLHAVYVELPRALAAGRSVRDAAR